MANEEVKPVIATSEDTKLSPLDCALRELNKLKLKSEDPQVKAAAGFVTLGIPPQPTALEFNPIADARNFVARQAEKAIAPWYTENKDVLNRLEFTAIETECHLPAAQATPAPRAASAPKAER